MDDGTWSQALAELWQGVVSAIVRFFKQDVVQVGLAGLFFFALAVPLLLVMLVLWYLDATGWRPEGGFYKIGQAPEVTLVLAQTALSSLGLG